MDWLLPGGVGGAQANSGTPFAYTTNDYKELLADPDIDLIAVFPLSITAMPNLLSRHWNAGKHVYCEKPLCSTLDELQQIKEAYEKSEGELFVGLKPASAPLIQQIKKV